MSWVPAASGSKLGADSIHHCSCHCSLSAPSVCLQWWADGPLGQLWAFGADQDSFFTPAHPPPYRSTPSHHAPESRVLAYAYTCTHIGRHTHIYIYIYIYTYIHMMAWHMYIQCPEVAIQLTCFFVKKSISWLCSQRGRGHMIQTP